MAGDRAGEAYGARVHPAVELIGRRRDGAMIGALPAGCERSPDVHDAISGLSDRLLCDRLRELEGAAIVERTVDASTPVDVRYRLTPERRALGPVLGAISRWAQDWEHRSEVFG